VRIGPKGPPEHAAEMQIVDLHEEVEFADCLGYVPDAELVPLSQLIN
jgi:hypothetical protein